MKAASFIYSAVSAAAVLSLASCVSNYRLPKDYTGPTAVIRSSHEEVGLVKAKGWYLGEVDGKFVPNSNPVATPYGGGMAVTLKERETVIPAQTTTLKLVGSTIYAADGAAMGDALIGGARYVSGTMTFTPKAGGNYRVKGILEPKGQESVWLVDEKTGKLAGEKIMKK